MVVFITELDFCDFINNDDDKTDRLQFICDILEFTNFSSTFNPINSINLSNNNLNTDDLEHIIKAIENNKKSPYFDTIHSINLSFNMFSDHTIIHSLVDVLRSKCTNLNTLNLENSGILFSLYNQQSFTLSASITWFTSNDNNNSFQFSYDSHLIVSKVF